MRILHLASLTVLCVLGVALTDVGAQTITLKVASFPDLDRGAKAAIEAFKRRHPNVDIQITSLAIADHHTAMTTALATGANLPDVMAVDMDFIGKFAQSGGLSDLTRPPFDAQSHRSKVARFAWSAAISDKGALSAMPVDIGPGALFYRTDLLQKAGLTEADLTRDWDGYIQAGKVLKAKTGAYLLSSAAALKDIYIRSGLKDGEGIYFDAKGAPLVDSPRFQRAFELAKAAREAGIDAKVAAWSNEWAEAFKRDRLASQMMGAWLAGHLKNWIVPQMSGLWRATQLPGGAYASWGGSFYAVPVKSAHPKEAWEFIRFLTLDKAQQIESFRALDAFPSLIEAQQDAFVDQPIDYLGGQKARLLWRSAADRIPALSVDRYDAVAASIVSAELDKVLEQNKDIKTALADAKSAIQRRVRRR